MKIPFTTTQIIAKEGWRYILIALVLFIASFAFDFFTWFFFFVFVGLLWIFRNPERIPEEDDPLACISPADGKVVEIGKEKDTVCSNKESLKIVIEISLWDVSLIRAPIDLEIIDKKRTRGLFLSSGFKYKKELSEKLEIFMKSGNRLLGMRLEAGLFARKINFAKDVLKTKQTSRIALLSHGRLELFLPVDTTVKVAVGDNLKAGESVIGYLPFGENNV